MEKNNIIMRNHRKSCHSSWKWKIICSKEYI